MFEWLAQQFGEQTALIIYYCVIFVALIIAVFILRWIWKNISGGTFVHGTKNERRLAVVDATAVDNRRRLVLVRRDNVEHLVMIGGMSDILIESNIGQSTSAEHVNQEDQVHVSARKKNTTAPAAAAPVIAAAEPAATQSAVEKAPSPEVETAVASVPDVNHEPAPAIEPQIQPATPATNPATHPAPPEPLVKEPQSPEASFDVAAKDTFSEHDFDLDISANELTADVEKTSRTANTFEPTVDFPSDKTETQNNDQAHKPLEDEMEALLNKLTSSEK